VNDALVLGFPRYRLQAQRLAVRAGLSYDDVSVHRFPDGGSLVRLPPRLPAQLVFFLSLDDPNAKLIALELAARTARDQWHAAGWPAGGGAVRKRSVGRAHADAWHTDEVER
jgi:hypothetical protein